MSRVVITGIGIVSSIGNCLVPYNNMMDCPKINQVFPNLPSHKSKNRGGY